jgi:hypothetical protein
MGPMSSNTDGRASKPGVVGLRPRHLSTHSSASSTYNVPRHRVMECITVCEGACWVPRNRRGKERRGCG